jgi:hypothetical protein
MSTPNPVRRPLSASALTLVVALGLGVACDDDYGSGWSSGPNGYTFDLTGVWSGTWTASTGESGTLSCELLQDIPTEGGGSPASISGTATLEGSPCFALLSVEASFNPGGFGPYPRVYGTFTDGSVTIEFFAGVTLDSKHLVGGTYEILGGGTCTGETGTFEASLSIPLQAPVILGESVTMYDDLGNSATFVQIKAIDPLTGRSLWVQRKLVPLSSPGMWSDAPPRCTKLRRRWWALGDSNTGQIDYESIALTN